MAIPILSQSMATTTIQWTNTQSLSLLFMPHTKATTLQITLLLISLVLLKKLNEIQCLLLQMLAVEPSDTTQRIHHAVVAILSPMTHCAAQMLHIHQMFSNVVVMDVSPQSMDLAKLPSNIAITMLPSNRISGDLDPWLPSK